MARIPYADENADEEVKALSARIRAERGGTLLNLYKMLLVSPPLAEGWLALLTAVRQKLKLRGEYRELAILRVALLNGASYEFDVHVPFALDEGITREQIDALREWQSSPAYSDAQRAVLAYIDAMTRDVHVDEAVFDALRPHLGERDIVELTATVASYNLVSRFLEALQVDPEPGQD